MLHVIPFNIGPRGEHGFKVFFSESWLHINREFIVDTFSSIIQATLTCYLCCISSEEDCIKVWIMDILEGVHSHNV